MAIANLHETLLSYKLRKAQLSLDITVLQSMKTLATYSQGDANSIKNAESNRIRDYFKNMYEEDEELQEAYRHYSEIPDFEIELDKLTAKYQDEFDDLAAWETNIDAQITSKSAELEEVNAYMESLKSMLSSNIQDDFNLTGN